MLINISSYAAWAPGLGNIETWQGHALPADDGAAPDIGFVDALMRRRLGRLSRMALTAANEVALAINPVTTIFASRHGELTRTVGILHSLAASETPSPTAFSLSVHNAAAGIFSIARADHSASSSLAAGEETLLWALLDASVRLAAAPDSPVLVVYADEPMPEEYQEFAAQSGQAHALALLLIAGESMSLEWTENQGRAASPEPFSLALLAYLSGHRDHVAWRSERLSIRMHTHA